MRFIVTNLKYKCLLNIAQENQYQKTYNMTNPLAVNLLIIIQYQTNWNTTNPLIVILLYQSIHPRMIPHSRAYMLVNPLSRNTTAIARIAQEQQEFAIYNHGSVTTSTTVSLSQTNLNTLVWSMIRLVMVGIFYIIGCISDGMNLFLKS